MRLISALLIALFLCACAAPGVTVTEGEANGMASFFGVNVRTVNVSIVDDPPVKVAVKCNFEDEPGCQINITPRDSPDG